MNRADCMQFLRRSGYPFKENFVARATDRDILIRMARNLILVYTQNSQAEKVAVLERIVTILKAYENDLVY
jgi:hypothetical protein